MKNLISLLALLTLCYAADSQSIITSSRAKADFLLSADPNSAAWKATPGIVTESGRRGEAVPHHRTEIRSRWTSKNLYLLFVCQYEDLNLKADPSTTTETDKLWEFDVAEAFIGTDFKNIKRYTEFQVSPQGEWVDLLIDRGTKPASHDVAWNSGYEVKAKLDQAHKIWYGEMRIPMNKIDRRSARVGNEMRINFYRIQGAAPNRKFITWKPVNSDNYHTPEAFGRLRLGI